MGIALLPQRRRGWARLVRCQKKPRWPGSAGQLKDTFCFKEMECPGGILAWPLSPVPHWKYEGIIHLRTSQGSQRRRSGHACTRRCTPMKSVLDSKALPAGTVHAHSLARSHRWVMLPYPVLPPLVASAPGKLLTSSFPDLVPVLRMAVMNPKLFTCWTDSSSFKNTSKRLLNL